MSVDRGFTMSAIYDGWCGRCKKPIETGDPITQADGDWVHDECSKREPEDLLNATHPVCQTCWLTHPEGACDR